MASSPAAAEGGEGGTVAWQVTLPLLLRSLARSKRAIGSRSLPTGCSQPGRRGGPEEISNFFAIPNSSGYVSVLFASTVVVVVVAPAAIAIVIVAVVVAVAAIIAAVAAAAATTLLLQVNCS